MKNLIFTKTQHISFIIYFLNLNYLKFLLIAISDSILAMNQAVSTDSLVKK